MAGNNSNVPSHSHIGILHSSRTQEEKNRVLFWKYLHAENWNSARVIYPRLTDPATQEIAREMRIRKRAAKAQEAFDRGLQNHARWHIKEITQFLRPVETDSSMKKLKELVDDLKTKLGKKPATKAGNQEDVRK